MTFKEFAVIAVSFGNEMKLGYPQRLTLKAHRDNDGKTKIKSWAKLMGRSRVRERKRKEKGERGRETFIGGRFARVREDRRGLRWRTRGMRKRGRNRVGNVGEKNGGEGCGTRSGAAPREERERKRG